MGRDEFEVGEICAILADVSHGGSGKRMYCRRTMRHGDAEDRVNTDFTVVSGLGARCFRLVSCFLSTSRFCEYESTNLNQIF